MLPSTTTAYWRATTVRHRDYVQEHLSGSFEWPDPRLLGAFDRARKEVGKVYEPSTHMLRFLEVGERPWQ